jgi:hypothetical protein
MLSGIDRVDSKLIDCIKMAESKTSSRIREEKPAENPKRQTPGLFGWGQPPSGKLQVPSPKPAHKWTPEPTNISDPLFDQDFNQFMEILDNLQPFDDLENWSDNVDLFMGAMAHPPQITDALWELVKLKKGKSKAPEQSSKSIFDKPWIKEPEGLTPTQSWLHWMNENALRVEMGIPLLAHPNHTYPKSVS